MGDGKRPETGGYRTYHPSDTMALIVPAGKDKTSVTHLPRQGKPREVVRPRRGNLRRKRPLAAEPLLAGAMRVLASYQPTKQELALVTWAEERFKSDPHIAAEVHAVVYRSITNMVIATLAEHMEIWRKAQELGAGFPKPELTPRV